MASFATVKGTLQNSARTNIAVAPNQATYGGTLHMEFHKYVMTDAEVTNDTIDICWLPAGATVVPHLSTVAASGDPGTTLTFTIGTEADPNRYADGVVLSAGGANNAWSSATLPLESYGPIPLTTATKIIATATVSTLSNTRTLIFWVAYILP